VLPLFRGPDLMTHLVGHVALRRCRFGDGLFVAVSLGQAFTRSGFDLTRHPLSLLSNGALGWLQITNFVVTGVLTLAGAVGLRRGRSADARGRRVRRDALALCGIHAAARGAPGNGERATGEPGAGQPVTRAQPPNRLSSNVRGVRCRERPGCHPRSICC
jgi:hypothetical protein